MYFCPNNLFHRQLNGSPIHEQGNKSHTASENSKSMRSYLKQIVAYCLVSLCPLSLLGQEQSKAVQLPKDWHRSWQEGAQGTRSDEALRFLLRKGKKPRPIRIGVIDTGADTTLLEIRPALYLSPRELPNGRDDDRDGYVDNRYGWNFLGSPNGEIELTSVGTTAFREYKRLLPYYKGMKEAPQGKEEEFAYFRRVAKMAGIERYERLQAVTTSKVKAFHLLDSVLRQLPNVHRDSLTLGQLVQLDLSGKEIEAAGELIAPEIIKADSTTAWHQLVQQEEQKLEQINHRLASIERDPDKRTLLGDDMHRLSSRSYGNGRVSGVGQEHGTFVSSVLVGAGTIDSTVKGVYTPAKLLTLRAVPDRGDEYDKDVAAAIVYAVDHGAKVINMSLGKDLSPSEYLVEEALRYAQKHDVLVVQSSGNNGRDLDQQPIYPTGLTSSGKPFPNFLYVGASTAAGARASFSNYGKHVHLYAPGEKIWGTMPGGQITAEDGTSIAAPIVAGIAAMIRAFFPRLTAPEVVELLFKTARQGEVPIVDALAACQAALQKK